MKKIILLLLLLGFSNVVWAASDYDKAVEAYNTQDYETALKLFRPLAEGGNAGSQYGLGVMYTNGQGVKQDYAKSVKWYQKAAEQGYANAQYNLGVKYDNGQGVKQDYATSVKWYQKAAEQGHAHAQNNLGVMYANGQGVKQDDDLAVKWYQKAAEQGHKKAKSNLEMLLAKASCQGSTKLFDVDIMCANRDDMMAATKKAGASAKQEDKNKWGDYYYSSNVLKGSSELYVGYTVDDYFAYAQYTFPSRMDSQQVVKIKNMVASKYGEPTYRNGNVGLGNVTYKWTLDDGIVLKVSRGWPNTTTYLRYTYSKNYKAMQDEMKRQRLAREKKEAQAQSNAF